MNLINSCIIVILLIINCSSWCWEINQEEISMALDKNPAAPECEPRSVDSFFDKTIIVDTDAGTDDSVAILILLSYEALAGNSVKTLFFTTVNGNVHADQVGLNVLNILETMNRLDIPVYRGVNESLIKTPWNNFYHGENGFGDYEYPNPPSSDLIREKHAVNAMVEAVAENPGKLSLVCLGPLTNVAMAVRMDANFLKNLKEIYVLGGSDSGLGNIKPGVEFNFYMDPHAAYIVMTEVEKAGIQMNLVTWETVSTKRSKIDMEWRKNVLGALNNPAVDLMNKIESKYMDEDFWVSADPILLSVFLDDEIVEKAENYHADVETCGEFSQGAIFIDYNDEEAAAKNIRLIEQINVERYKSFLLKYFQEAVANGA